MIKIGVVGCGYWGPNLVRTFNEIPGAKVVAVSDLRPGRLDFIQARYPSVRTAAQAEDLIQDTEIDALVIATPPNTHHELAMAALAAGKHLLVEKPLTMDVRESEEIVERAEKAGKVLMTGHLFLYAPAVVEMRRRLQAGEFGDLYYISSTRANLGPPNTKVDVLWDLAPHDVSVILDLMGEFPSEIHAHGACFTGSGFAEAVFVTLRFSDGRMAHIEVSWLTPAKVRWMRLVCKDKTVHFDDASQTEKLRIFDSGVDSRLSAGATGSQAIGYGPGTITIPALPSTEPLRAECEDFIECIRTQRVPVSSGRKGLDVVRILQTAATQIALQGEAQAVSR